MARQKLMSDDQLVLRFPTQDDNGRPSIAEMSFTAGEVDTAKAIATERNGVLSVLRYRKTAPKGKKVSAGLLAA